MLTVFLARHAEKQAGADPSLTPEGEARAKVLAGTLADAGITIVWTTDYARTRETAAPLVERTGADLRVYDPGQLAAFAETLRSLGGVHFVSGHSNTTPDLVARLGGEPGAPIDEVREYDRLYRINLYKDGRVGSDQRRYGRRTPLIQQHGS
ncbi:MAG: phosphoglycerate mutase family protein [Pseudomonadota bacterium]